MFFSYYNFNKDLTLGKQFWTEKTYLKLFCNQLNVIGKLTDFSFLGDQGVAKPICWPWKHTYFDWFVFWTRLMWSLIIVSFCECHPKKSKSWIRFILLSFSWCYQFDCTKVTVFLFEVQWMSFSVFNVYVIM